MPVLPESLPATGTYLPTLLKEIKDGARNSLHNLARKEVPQEIRVQTMVVVGTTAQEIAQLAAAENADIIVIATHGQSGWKRFISGSVTERVLRFADRPVLTIHSPEQEEQQEEEGD